MDFKRLTDYLIQQNIEKITLTYSDIETILGKQLPLSLTEHGGFTQKSQFGIAVLSSGFLFKNSYTNQIITFEKNKNLAEQNLNDIDIKSTRKKINIFLNIVFPHSAEYVNSKGNIGHEIIDLFGGDNSQYHYYLNPWGLVDKNNIPQVVLSICQSSTGLYKILNKAVIEKPDYSFNDKEEDLYFKQKGKFLYNNKYLEEYFDLNAGGNTVLSSLSCKGIFEPTKPIYFAFKTFKQKRLQNSIYRLVSTTPGRATVFKQFNQRDQELLEALVMNETIWHKKPIKSFKKYVEEYENLDNFNYFEELGIKNQELQYSNAIRFFLSHYNITNNLLKKLGCQISKKESFNIERERYNIDLFLTNFDSYVKSKNNTDEKIVIIENKIKANVTPSDNEKTLEEQIRKIYRHVKEIDEISQFTDKQEKEINKICSLLKINKKTSEIPSQLSKYYIYALIIALERRWPSKKIHNDIYCFFLCPEYSKTMYETDKDGFLLNNTFIGRDETLFLQDKYKLITYKDILPAFEKCLKTIRIKDKYSYLLEDFINSLKEQAKDRDDSLEQTMIKMFYLRSKNI